MSKSGGFRNRDRFDDEYVKERRPKAHMTRIHEKHIRNALRSPHLVDLLAEEDEDL